MAEFNNKGNDGRAKFLGMLSQVSHLTDDELHQLEEEIRRELNRRENLNNNQMELPI